MLGPVELCYDGVPVEVSGTTRTLLALLARTPCEEVSTATIVAVLWGSQPPEDCESQVASMVARLRKALTAVAPNVDPTSVVVTLPTGYLLAIHPSNVDILSFERLLADARRAIAVGQPALALRQVDAALQLWRGTAYEGFVEPDGSVNGELDDQLSFLRTEAKRLEDLRLAAIECRVDALLALHAPGVPPNLLPELQALTAEYWHRERLWGQLMTVLVRLGRRSDALAVHRRAVEQLAQRLNVQPGAELRAVEEAVIDRDPRLFGVPLQPTTVPAALAITFPPCLGREQEIDWLCAAMDLAATRRAQARLIVGTPGMGKTRVIAEVAKRAAERGAVIRYWRADARGLESHVAEPDRLTVVIVEDLDRAPHEDVTRVTTFVRSVMTRPVVTFVTCRDPVRVGDLVSVPKLVLSALDDAAITDIVRIYAPSASEKAAAAAMVNTGGVPAKVHRAASEWAFARAGRRIDRAVADSAEPRRTLEALREEVITGALELAHVRARARSLRPTVRPPGCPYPGLNGFGPGDAELFHGRERLVAEVLARLVEAPLLALVGDAGTGKTSLLRAGVLPAIAAGVLPDSSRWRQVVVTPSTMGGALADLMAPPPRPTPAVPVELARSNPLVTPTALLPVMTADRTTSEPDHAAETSDPTGADEDVPDFVATAPATPAGEPEESAESAEAGEYAGWGEHAGPGEYTGSGQYTGPRESTEEPSPPPEMPGGLGHRNGILPTGPLPPSTPNPARALTGLTPTTGLPALRLPVSRTPAVDVLVPGSTAPTVRPAAARVTTVTAVTEPVIDEDEPAPTLLVVDQFEEIFVLFDDRQREEFVEALLAATETGRVLISVRSDFYRHCARHPVLAELMAANLVPVTPMTEDELRRAIVRPAEIAGLEVEPGLVDRLIAEVEDGHGGLTHLAVTLRELWHGRTGTTLTLAAYQAGPGLADAIAAYAESVFAGLPTPQARSAARALLAGMCTLTEDRLAVRTRANLTELLSRAGGGALPALEVLAAGGLVTVSPEIDTVTLRHDCLLTEWPRLREALDDTAAETSLRRHLRRAADAWAAGGRSANILYRGARLVTMLDWADRHSTELSTVERDFLAASQRAALAVEMRRKRRMLLLWKWVAGMTALALLATGIAVVSVVMQLKTAAGAVRSDAARLGVQAAAEPDLRGSLLLAIAAARLDGNQTEVVRSVLQRTPDLVTMAGSGVTALAVSPDGAIVAAGTGDGPILLLQGDDLATVATVDYPGHGPVNGLSFTPDGRRLVSWGGGGTSDGAEAASIVVWDVANHRPTGTAFGQVWPGSGGGLLADGVTLVLTHHGRDPQAPTTVAAWNIDARTPSTTYPLPTSPVDSVVVAPDGSVVAFGTGGSTTVLTVADGTTRTLPGAVTPLAFTADAGMLLTAAGPVVQVWDLASGSVDDEAPGDAVPLAPRSVTAHRDQVLAAAWAPDGASFATVGSDGVAVVWSLSTLSPLRSFTAGPAPMTGVRFAPDARTLYTVGGSGTILAFDLTGGRGVGTALASTPDNDPGLITLACRIAGRGLTPEEWALHLPDRRYRQTCP